MEPPLNADGTIDEAGHEVMLESIDLPYAKTRRLRERAARIVERRAAKSPLSRLKTEDRKRIMPLRDGVELIGVPNEHRADELAAALHAEFPWMGPATEVVWHAMRRSIQCGAAAAADPARRSARDRQEPLGPASRNADRRAGHGL